MQMLVRTYLLGSVIGPLSCLLIAFASLGLGTAGGSARGQEPATGPAAKADVDEPVRSLAELITEDRPVAYWSFDGPAARRLASRGELEAFETATGKAVGARLDVPGPAAPEFPGFSVDNRALALETAGARVVVGDPGEASPLDFANGDALTIEAWVQLEQLPEGRQVYVVGKGRTARPDQAAHNQNYALRLRGMDGTARLSFLFRTAGTESAEGQFHRWNSEAGIRPGSGWHHVAISYQFGAPDTLRAYVDGRPTAGSWDMGGPTDRPPVVDDDQLWIGSSMGGSAASTFPGKLDEIAIYRRLLPADRVALRYARRPPPPRDLPRVLAELPRDAVQLSLLPGAGDGDWQTRRPPARSLQLPVAGLDRLPKHYVPPGVIGDTPNPTLVRLSVRWQPPAGKYHLVLRAKSAAQLRLDDKLLAETSFMQRAASGHEAVPPLPESQFTALRPLTPGHQERVVSVTLDGAPHLLECEAVVGGKGVRAELGEVMIAAAAQSSAEQPPVFHLVTASGGPQVPLTQTGWLPYRKQLAQLALQWDTQARLRLRDAERDYWDRRHQWARQVVAARRSPAPASEANTAPAQTPPAAPQARLDALLAPHLGQHPEPAERLQLLRRLTLDTVGVIPTRQELQAFLRDSEPQRIPRAIDRLLADPRWADHWVSYWQDVLAENPGILKPKLNNTGPFRYWIYEAVRDNLPLDRFVTELVQMRGSVYEGGPAGFGMATQNDVPQAAKAHVLSQAFLGLEMKCARCHDAPYHPYQQQQLFELAAMLARKPLQLPASSTVPVEPGGRQPHVTISLKPGEQLQPTWPFPQFSGDFAAQLNTGAADATRWLRDPADTRERLSLQLTNPHNQRFAQVLANRLWQRLFGHGIVEPVDDWHEAAPADSQLLEFLGDELIAHGYDLKHLARLILNSAAYQQRAATPAAPAPPAGSPAKTEGAQPHFAQPHFAQPQLRRMSAEQLADSLMVVAGKELATEPLSLDPEGRRPATTFLNLGRPSRAWEFTGLSNERDRPALALPAAQSFVDLLLAFGWRESRPDPLSQREPVPTVLQPLALAHGVVSRRVTRLSDDHALTALALTDRPLAEFIDQLFLAVLARHPEGEEQQLFVELLGPGYDQRVVGGARAVPPPQRRIAVSWSNHLHPDATRRKQELEALIRQGDPPTARLTPAWRERLEDGIWSLINSPEFVFVP